MQNLLANECELRNSGEGADKSALTHEGTAKEVRSTSNCSFAPWGEGQDEGSYKLDATGMTPHQVRTKLAKRIVLTS